jgi:hypothetical protein
MGSMMGVGGGAVKFAAVGMGSAGLLNWMPAGDAWTGKRTDAGTGGMGCFDMRNTAAKGGRSSVV